MPLPLEWRRPMLTMELPETLELAEGGREKRFVDEDVVAKSESAR